MYFSFLNLFLINISLIGKILNLSDLENLRFESVIIFNLYSFFVDASAEFLLVTKVLNLKFVKTLIFAFIFNLYALNYINLSNNFVLNFVMSSRNLIQEYLTSDMSSFFFFKKGSAQDLEDTIVFTELYDIFFNDITANLVAEQDVIDDVLYSLKI